MARAYNNKNTFKKGNIPWNKGKKAKDFPKLARALEKAHKATIGLPPWNKGKRVESLQGYNSSSWKGDKVGRAGIYNWLYSKFGKPTGCERCGTYSTKTKYNWVNKDGKYRRRFTDYERLCQSCFAKKKQKQRKSIYTIGVWQKTHEPWNKGKKYTMIERR